MDPLRLSEFLSAHTDPFSVCSEFALCILARSQQERQIQGSMVLLLHQLEGN